MKLLLSIIASIIGLGLVGFLFVRFDTRPRCSICHLRRCECEAMDP